MASKIDICNMALSRLGLRPIQSFSDNTTEAKTLSIIYDQVARNVMSLGPWTSCTFRATLAQLTETPDWEFAYIYQLPTDPKCIRVLSVNEARLGDIEYRIEGSRLLSNEVTAQVKFIGFVSDTESYDDYLRQAVTERLIVELSYSKTGNASILNSMERLYTERVEQWLNINNAQGSGFDLPSDTFIDARHEF